MLKKSLIVLLVILIPVTCLVLFLLVWNFSVTPTGRATHAAVQIVAGTSVQVRPSPTATPAPALTAREQNLAKARRLVAEYEQAVQAELEKGGAILGAHPVTGEQTIRLPDEARERIQKLYDELNQDLSDLNEQYLALYIAEVQPTPFPTRAAPAETEAAYQQLVDAYPAYLDQVLAEGPTVQIYDPDEGLYSTRLIGDSHARSETMLAAIEALRQAPLLAQVDQAAHMDRIRVLLEQPELALTFAGVSELANAPWVDAAVYVDEDGTRYSVALEANRLVGIEPGYRPEVPALEVRPVEAVLPLAIDLARAGSPRFAELEDQLRLEQGSKGDLYFFTWRIPGRDWTGSDWALMPPFLQIGMTADGKLATYINTLDLYEE